MSDNKAALSAFREEVSAWMSEKFEISRGHRARVCGLWSNHCMFLAIWTQ